MDPKDLKLDHWYLNDYFLRQEQYSLQEELECTGLLRYGGHILKSRYYKFYTFAGYSYDLISVSITECLEPISNAAFKFFKLFLDLHE